jgi:hypothetical protein
MSYWKDINIAQDIATVSTANTLGDIATGAAASGSFEEITNQTAVQFIAKYDQNTTIYIDQSLAGSVPDITDTFHGVANAGLASYVASVAPYYRVRVKNESITAPASGSLVAAKTAIWNVLPRSLGHNGGLAMESPYDDYGFRAEYTPQGRPVLLSRHVL